MVVSRPGVRPGSVDELITPTDIGQVWQHLPEFAWPQEIEGKAFPKSGGRENLILILRQAALDYANPDVAYKPIEAPPTAQAKARTL